MNTNLPNTGLDASAVGGSSAPLTTHHSPLTRRYWRSLDELAGTPEFAELFHREFPDQAWEWTDPLTRRQFLMLMGASVALAGASGCTKPPAEKIVPYVRQPEEIVPGKPLFYATAMTLAGSAIGLLVESHMGRPIKVEGNPDHPASLGATDVFAQASILTLYDPDRSQNIIYRGQGPSQIRTWDDTVQALRIELEKQAGKKGAGLRVLTETIVSPTLGSQLEKLLEKYPEAKWVQYEPVNRDNVLAGAELAFGKPVNTYYRFDQAERILSLDADFLSCGPGHLRYVHDFMNRRRMWAGQKEMNRLYVVESTPTLTGAKADHRFPMRASEIVHVAPGIAMDLGAGFWYLTTEFTEAVGDDLKAHQGKSIVIAGDQQPALVHALAHAMNHVLGNVGTTVVHTRPMEVRPTQQMKELQQLVMDMADGRVEVLVILGGNPVYNAPADLEFGKHFAKVPLRLHLSLYDDETSQLCHWHIPEAHYLETWSDTRAYDGTASIVQPLIAPLYGGKSAHELLAALSGEPERSAYDFVREYWRKQKLGGSDFERSWQRSLHDGVVAGTAFPSEKVDLQNAERWARTEQPKAAELEIVFRPDPTVFDGRFANNGWLQELPKPLTKLTWDNAVLMSPATAAKRGLSTKPGSHGGEHGEILADVVTLHYRDQPVVEAPVWIVPGHPDDSVTVYLGYGRSRAGKVGTNVGFNAYALRRSDRPWFDATDGVRIEPTGKRYTLACTQHHHLMENRRLVRAGTLEEYRKKPDFAADQHHNGRHSLTLYDDKEYPNPRYKWGMAIDLSACTGCSACVIACQAENNIPIVGKTEITRGREMHWLRIDRYYEYDPNRPETKDNPPAYFQPVPCMQCENAPCELVCPVGATSHSDEGLNDQVYGRCVGTRYCSHNCPYKVRRFNFFEYADYATASLKLLRNPDVSVRTRGVMEKCTYCVQRINHARIQAEKEDRTIRDGEILTACQAACPAGAIVFGDLNDQNSKVSRMKKQSLNYGLLEDLNTRPRTTYLAAVRNPNPLLEGT